MWGSNLGSFLSKAEHAAVSVAETVPGLGTAVKVGEAAIGLLHPSNGGSATAVSKDLALGTAGGVALVGGSMLAAKAVSHHHHRLGHRSPVQHRPHRHRHHPQTGECACGHKKHHKAHHTGKRHMTAKQLQYFGKGHKHHKAA